MNRIKFFDKSYLILNICSSIFSLIYVVLILYLPLFLSIDTFTLKSIILISIITIIFLIFIFFFLFNYYYIYNDKIIIYYPFRIFIKKQIIIQKEDIKYIKYFIAYKEIFPLIKIYLYQKNYNYLIKEITIVSFKKRKEILKFLNSNNYSVIIDIDGNGKNARILE